MPPAAVEQYEFGPFRMDSAERLLRNGDRRIPLPPKVAETLLVLLRNAGRMVDKADLIKTVWPDTFVEEGALARNISLLRKALGDTGEEARYVETIPRRGYRFVAPVGTPAEPAAPTPDPPPPHTAASRRRWKTAAAILLVATLFSAGGSPRHPASDDLVLRAAARRSTGQTALAVLPLRSIAGGAAEDDLADVITQTLITTLSRFGRVRVKSLAPEGRIPADSAVWKAIMDDPAVSRVLTGTLVQSGGRLRIDVRLIDPRTREVYWANHFERGMDDLLSTEAELAQAIAAEVNTNLTAGDRGRLRLQVNPHALDAYLRGRYFWNRRTEEGLKRAVQYFQEAIAAAPDYAPAYSGLADSYALLGSVGVDNMRPNHAMPLAKAAAEKALALDPDLADAHVSLAYVHLSYYWDLPAAAREFTRALELDPNSATGRHWLSHYFMAAGDLKQAGEQMRAALELETLSPSINIGIGWCLYYSRDFDGAIEQFRGVTESDPQLPLAHQTLAMAYQQNAEYDLALKEYQTAAQLSGGGPGAVAGLATVYAAMGRHAEARQQLSRLEELARRRYVSPLYFANVHFALGDLPTTVKWGWKAVGERCDYLIYLGVEPRVGKLAANPDFLRAMASVHR